MDTPGSWDSLVDSVGRGLKGLWQKKQWMNTPGPFYTAGADFALVGIMLAPELTAVDTEELDIVFRQPLTTEEAEDLLEAASWDAFEGYASDGSCFWTPALVGEWWGRRSEILFHITNNLMRGNWCRHPEDWPSILPAAANWKAYLENDAEVYLRKYCYFLENRQWPTDQQKLPDL